MVLRIERNAERMPLILLACWQPATTRWSYVIPFAKREAHVHQLAETAELAADEVVKGAHPHGAQDFGACFQRLEHGANGAVDKALQPRALDAEDRKKCQHVTAVHLVEMRSVPDVECELVRVIFPRLRGHR